ncbi:MAG: hypothetical protein KKD01_08515 [Proteobacteria bacterium]|nr:hypothetical protein [Pseudomonadota bacterium]MBU1234981.1 hypothetical protein [Pseudomonadota bacterium]MBU1417602.1 hypothetical protein [Pseudomonadota bacterium]MBU1454753.1 hypothetical protein [Pseudomonadota bacterium]
MSSPQHYNKTLRKHGEPEPTLYLARSVLKSPVRFSLRLSYWSSTDNCFRTCELADLGISPDKFICYANDTSFHLKTDFVDHISSICGGDRENELELLFWPFVEPSVQQKMDHFFHRGAEQVKFQPGNKLLSFDGRPPHFFDQRRLHFLRFGATDQGKVFRMPPRLLAKLLNRSRDELEQYFLEEEGRLREHELKSYLYAALNLQHHFSETYARSFPQALSPEKIDEFFLLELCRLNDDHDFWQERTDYSGLSIYLIRYLILFFDSSFPRQSRGFEQAREFINGHREFRWPERKNKVSTDEISSIFEESAETLRQADKKELSKLFRNKAKALHPDTGGDHEKFVRLIEAYEELLRGKK